MEKHTNEAKERRRKSQDVWELEENIDALGSRMARNMQHTQGSKNLLQIWDNPKLLEEIIL